MICSVIFDTFLPKKKSLSFPKNLEQSRSIEHREGCTKWGEVQKKKKAADFTDELPRATTAAFPLSKGV